MPDDTGSPLAALPRAAAQAEAFRRRIDEGPQRAEDDYHASLARFDEPLPEGGRPATEVIDQLVARATPGLQKSAGRRFFGWVIGNSHPVGVAADWLASAWGQNAGNPVASPAAAACEAVAAQWLLELLDLPREASVGFVTGATMANFVGLAAARSAVLARVGWDVQAQGLFGAPPIQVLIGDDAHATVYSALQYLGLGHARVTRIATDARGAIDPAAFAQAVTHITGPAIVILQAGQINTGACDDFARLVPLAQARGAWVHVDGAFGLWARTSREHAACVAGIEQADSWATDGHKWLQTPYDCGYAIVRDARAHWDAMSINASYLPVGQGERDPSHYVPELSRRARGFATWAMIAHLGRRGIGALVEQHVRVARLMAARLAQAPGVEVVNTVVLNQLIVRFGTDRPADEADRLTRATIARLQADGEAFAGGAQWRGRWVMRISVIGSETHEAEGERSAQAILAAWRQVRAQPSA
ncbi:pyridoxal phosphate-dependent decarboxylase family protein [Aquabacterium sp.]|uniref:pyridoxal phosphate-dependent decarboxylase family protein n=1 Tax=Aquabacterium sp. TaxID=1872578 RepID=UPI003783C2C3